MSANFSDDAYRDQVKQNYEFAQWAGRTREGDANVRVTGFTLAGGRENFTIDQREDLTPSDRQNRVTRYICVAPAGRGPVRIATVFECKSVNDAHETLIDVVMTYMARNLPRCETRGLTVGDICFGSHGEVNLSLIFARFNILVEIKSTTPGTTPVDELARAIDSLILTQFRAAPR
jgi:hypothetical protein